MGEKLFDEFWSSYLSQLPFNALSFLGLVPKEKLSLGKFFVWCFGTVNGFQRIRVVSRVPCFCADSHGSRGEILHLFKLKIQFFGDDGEVCHILCLTTGMTANEIGDELLF